MKKGILEFCILSIIKKGEAYPSDIVEEMKQANMQILEGTLYPLLTRLKNSGMLSYRWVESSSGPPRKYFSLTDQGQEFYSELEKTWRDLANGVERVINGRSEIKQEPGITAGTHNENEENKNNSDTGNTTNENQNNI